MSHRESTLLAPRHFAWIPNQELATLRIADRSNGYYCDLRNPSRTLALQAIWEAIIAYNEAWQGSYNAPPLEILAVPR